ncbi:MAG: hypothetical protein ABSF69_23945 [Polyangiaceae bacterium]|jgi:hypothetical protein
MESQVQNATKDAHVTLGIDEQPPVPESVPAGDTKVSALRQEFGVESSMTSKVGASSAGTGLCTQKNG